MTSGRWLPKACASSALNPNLDVISQLRTAGFSWAEGTDLPAAAGVFAGKVFVLTGTLPSLSREEATALIEGAGGKVSGSVSSKTYAVVVGAEAGTKLAKAQSLSLTIWDEASFLSKLGAAIAVPPATATPEVLPNGPTTRAGSQVALF